MRAMVVDEFIACAEAAERLIGNPAVIAHWDQPSALEGYAVAGLAGHLARAVLTVETYLDASAAPAAKTTDAAGYLTTVLGAHDPLDSDFHRNVRARGQQTAADGPAALVATLRATRERLAAQLQPDDVLHQHIEVFDGVTLTVGEYLKTRLLELVVHTDDLAVSLGHSGPENLPPRAYEAVAALLGQVAARRVGGLTTVRSLARRERQPDGVRAL